MGGLPFAIEGSGGRPKKSDVGERTSGPGPMFLSPGESSVVLVPHCLTVQRLEQCSNGPFTTRTLTQSGLIDPLKFRWFARLKLPRALGGVAARGDPRGHGTTL